ncbi:LOW QUALITY PROTEIN: voltage-dependent calcium channel subunit alpha-2/delta-3 [Bemisia tabaci]|uniref:LOW QUALITY PROTEIN: voltage-dependent calcium channel subunit alpha-2/delta-3 n=1 Tax=Bemisia tabaci TaxID=7038 RepID=UPI003B2815DE
MVSGPRGAALCAVLLVVCLSESRAKEEEKVESWAVKLGLELWELGSTVTKATEIRARYKQYNARVLPTDGEAILKSIVRSADQMLKQKMEAVICIMEAAEDLAEAFEPLEEEEAEKFTYHSSKYSRIHGNEENPEPHPARKLDGNETKPVYKDIVLVKDRHFYGIPVNTNYSAVHVPSNVFDQWPHVQHALQWSEGLDEVFEQNYQADPSLSWQYFASATGMLRHYPGIRWFTPEVVDSFDCRTLPWYIQAATCSKDMVILIDNSGSMTGMRNTIAQLTVNSLLKTLDNNDFVNIFRFNVTAEEIVPCFNNTLVQATPENIAVFKEAINNLQPEGKADFPVAFQRAFELLQQYRETKSCPDRICNQAVMLVTDSVPGNLTEVFEKYNWFENRTHIPVRVFTFLLGREVTNVREIQWMACLNRGYYVHIHTMDEVQDQVQKYIPVIARPLVLQGVEHPVTWTHAFVDITDPTVAMSISMAMAFEEQKDRLDRHLRSKIDDERFSMYKEDMKYIHKLWQREEESETMSYQEYRMMTSVSVPAYDRKINKQNNTKSASLLGVAGAAVPTDDFLRLTLPYKIGANGYAFVITNNGYLLLHPDLRPVERGTLKDNYNSIDLTEVEFLDDDNDEPREPSLEILRLREEMISHNEGKMLDLKMKFHYDDMRRVGAETRHYFYAPLKNTPFTMGLMLPHSYGNYWIKAGDEIKKSMQMGIPLQYYFQGNWNIHPKWVYCDYHRSSGPWFESREAKLLHFLKMIQAPGWRWNRQYPADEQEEEEESEEEPDSTDSSERQNRTHPTKCNRRTIEDEEYYCDKELMHLLVFDAKITEGTYKTSKWAAKSRQEMELVERYNASVRFLATQSGLTRWQHIPDEIENDNFGDLNNAALEEVWYRSAVLQHHINPEAFVFHVPFESGERENITVTASHAIFPRDGGHEAPGSVVGFQFSHEALYNRFIDITSKSNSRDFDYSCTTIELDCYIIDGNGYVVVSENRNDTGRFFGELEGAIMEAMVSKNIFRRIPMFDYQSLCFEELNGENSDASSLLTPLNLLHHILKWFFSHFIWILLQSNRLSLASVYEEEEYGFSDEEWVEQWVDTVDSEPEEKAPEIEVKSEPCDWKADLYLLQHLSAEGYQSSSIVNCSRPFIVKRIPHTNLLLIVVNTLHQSCYRPLSAQVKKVEYNETILSCNKLYLNSLPRRRLAGCYNEHPEVSDFPK